MGNRVPTWRRPFQTWQCTATSSDYAQATTPATMTNHAPSISKAHQEKENIKQSFICFIVNHTTTEGQSGGSGGWENTVFLPHPHILRPCNCAPGWREGVPPTGIPHQPMAGKFVMASDCSCVSRSPTDLVVAGPATSSE